MREIIITAGPSKLAASMEGDKDPTINPTADEACWGWGQRPPGGGGGASAVEAVAAVSIDSNRQRQQQQEKHQ